jgi:peptidoglycan hydrolase-like protein with peptidoglycan-binding domain
VNDRPTLSPEARKWMPAAAAAGVLAVVVIAGVALGGGDDTGSAPPASVDTVSFSSIASVPAIEIVETSAPVAKTQLTRSLAKGMAGDDVAEVQQRLTDLGFWPGPVDGYFGDETRRSVWAYEKLVLGVAYDEPTGQVTSEMWDEMQDPFVIAPRRPNSTPNHTEVYLPEQVIAVFHDDQAVFISHMSSGDNEDWCEEVTISPGEYNNPGDEPLVRGECGRSITPGGVFNFNRRVEGVRQSSLGGMWDPVYFNYGIAVHGALNVPLAPASHGCIRIPLPLSPTFQDVTANGDQVFVFDGVKEPEEYGAQLPYFNRIDPDYVTTTTSTTTTTTVPPTSTTTTVATTTTAPATNTTSAPATTTAAAPTTTTTTTTAAPASP